jgi:NAD(P)H dehydrogenase (quinone)
MSVVITGAAGKLARLVTELVLERLPASELILVTTRPAELEEAAARGTEIRYGSFDEPEALPAAFAGAQRMLLISTMNIGRRPEQHRNAIGAAAAAGVRHIAYTSGQTPTPENPAIATREHAATEEALRESGLAWTMLRNGLYSELRVPAGAEAVATGRYFHNAGDGRTAYVSRADCAAVAAALLVDGGYENEALDVTGPELHTQSEIASIISEVAGRPVEAVDVSDEERTAQFAAGGYTADAAASAASWGKAIRAGVLGNLTSVVPDLTGRSPRTVREILTEHRDALLGA